MGVDRVREFTELIATKIRELDLAAAGLKHHSYDPPAPWVADAILRAVEAHILEIRPSPGRWGHWALAYEGPLLVNVSGRLVRSTVYWTHRVADKSRMFAPEAAVSVAAAARLVLDFGYPVDAVQVESDDSEVDGVAFDFGGEKPRPILAVEAKLADKDVPALVAGVAACGGTGDERDHRDAMLAAGLRIDQAWPGNHHKKCPFLWTNRPVGFWAVSPGLPDGPDGKIHIARPVGDRFVLKPAPFATLHRPRLLEALART